MSDGIAPIAPRQIAIGDGGATIDADGLASDIGDAGTATQGASVPFVDLFKHALADANDAAHVSDQMTTDFAAGKNDDIHGTMIAVKQADIELRLVGTVKNKIVDAINDLLRTSI